MIVQIVSRKGFLSLTTIAILLFCISCGESPGSGSGGGGSSDTIPPRDTTKPGYPPKNDRVFKLKPIYIDVVDSVNSPETLRRIATYEQRLQARVDRLNKSGKGRYQFSIQKTLLITNEKKQILLIERRIHMMKCYPCTVPPDEDEDADDGPDEASLD